MNKEQINEALKEPVWINHKLNDKYSMVGNDSIWKIAYYPLTQNGKTNEIYEEARVLMESPIKNGTDFREVPLRYIKKL